MINFANHAPSALVDRYIAEVEAGGAGIGEYERWMVERYQRDKVEAAARGIMFDIAKATYGCQWFQSLVHTEGEWRGEPFGLLPHQAFWIFNLEGWRWADTKRRRFRKAMIYIARKAGKTEFSAGYALKELVGEEQDFPEPRGEVFVAATREEQAARTWHKALSLMRASDEVFDSHDPELWYITGERNTKKGGQIMYLGTPNTNAVFKACSKGDANSLSPHCVIKDEMHAYREDHRAMSNELSTGSGARQQPIELITTTAGDDNSEILYEQLSYAEHVVEAAALGEVVDDTLFAAIYRVDERHGEAWLEDPELWRQANPGLPYGVPSRKYIADQVHEAKHNPTQRQSVARYHMNVTVTANEQAFPREAWNKGRSCLLPGAYDAVYGGVDLSMFNDFSAVAIVRPKRLDGVWHYGVKVKIWCCRGTCLDLTRYPFCDWIKDGWLEYQSEEAIDTLPIKTHIREQHAEQPFHSINFDGLRMTEMSSELLNEGVPMEHMAQTPRNYEPAVHEFLKALEEGRIHHEGHPVLDWMARNTGWHKQSATGYRMPAKGRRDQTKESHKKKVDGVSSVLMAMAAAINDLTDAPTGNAVIF
jgi:phage terminase large subunit-like protein